MQGRYTGYIYIVWIQYSWDPRIPVLKDIIDAGYLLNI